MTKAFIFGKPFLIKQVRTYWEPCKIWLILLKKVNELSQIMLKSSVLDCKSKMILELCASISVFYRKWAIMSFENLSISGWGQHFCSKWPYEFKLHLLFHFQIDEKYKNHKHTNYVALNLKNKNKKFENNHIVILDPIFCPKVFLVVESLESPF